MKKAIFAAASFLLLLASCGTVQRTTSTTLDVSNTMSTATLADLEVGARVTYTYSPTKEERVAGFENCKNAAVSALLKANGNADLLVAPEYSFKGDMKTIEVSGRPAKYKNFRTAQ